MLIIALFLICRLEMLLFLEPLSSIHMDSLSHKDNTLLGFRNNTNRMMFQAAPVGQLHD